MKRPYTYYDRSGGQRSSKALRVFFVQSCPVGPKSSYEPEMSSMYWTGKDMWDASGKTHSYEGGCDWYAIAREAAFGQFGHFMMGKIRVGKRSVTVTGGEDLDESALGGKPPDACPLPEDIWESWKKGEIKSSASLAAVQQRFPAFAQCLIDRRAAARKRR